MKRSRASIQTPPEEELRLFYRIGQEAKLGASTAALVAKYKLKGDYARKARQFSEQFSPADLENCFPSIRVLARS